MCVHRISYHCYISQIHCSVLLIKWNATQTIQFQIQKDDLDLFNVPCASTLIIHVKQILTSTSISQQPLPARVVEVPPDAPLEEALAALAGEHAVVLPAGLVPTHHTVHHAGLVLVPDVHVAAAGLGRSVLFLPLQVSLLPQSISVPIGVAPSPAHHGHILWDVQSCEWIIHRPALCPQLLVTLKV